MLSWVVIASLQLQRSARLAISLPINVFGSFRVSVNSVTSVVNLFCFLQLLNASSSKPFQSILLQMPRGCTPSQSENSLQRKSK
jgi:hypothetical protein